MTIIIHPNSEGRISVQAFCALVGGHSLSNRRLRNGRSVVVINQRRPSATVLHMRKP